MVFLRLFAATLFLASLELATGCRAFDNLVGSGERSLETFDTTAREIGLLSAEFRRYYRENDQRLDELSENLVSATTMIGRTADSMSETANAFGNASTELSGKLQQVTERTVDLVATVKGGVQRLDDGVAKVQTIVDDVHKDALPALCSWASTWTSDQAAKSLCDVIHKSRLELQDLIADGPASAPSAQLPNRAPASSPTSKYSSLGSPRPQELNAEIDTERTPTSGSELARPAATARDERTLKGLFAGFTAELHDSVGRLADSLRWVRLALFGLLVVLILWFAYWASSRVIRRQSSLHRRELELLRNEISKLLREARPQSAADWLVSFPRKEGA